MINITAGRTQNTVSQSWCTPLKYVQAVREFYNGEIELDPCSNDESIVCAKFEYRLPEKDGLIEEWKARKVYINPPYGRDKARGTTIKDWLKKCEKVNKEQGSEVIALIPVATNTSHWKEHIFGKAAAICFLSDTRLKFRISGSEENKGCPVACCLVYWGGNYDRFNEVFKKFGAVVRL